MEMHAKQLERSHARVVCKHTYRHYSAITANGRLLVRTAYAVTSSSAWLNFIGQPKDLSDPIDKHNGLLFQLLHDLQERLQLRCLSLSQRGLTCKPLTDGLAFHCWIQVAGVR